MSNPLDFSDKVTGIWNGTLHGTGFSHAMPSVSRGLQERRRRRCTHRGRGMTVL
jgi:hypothetical protein